MRDMVLPEDSQRFSRAALPVGLFGPAVYGAAKQRRHPTSKMSRVDGTETGESIERARVVEALERCDWNQTAAAKVLGVSRRTLVSRLTEYGLTRRRPRPPG